MEMIQNSTHALGLTVIGVGNSGGQIVRQILRFAPEDLDMVVLDSDAEALRLNEAPHKIEFGLDTLKGMGSAGQVSLAESSFLAEGDGLIARLPLSQVTLLTAGLGGGTASGVLPHLVTKIKNKNSLCVVFVALPFAFEGRKRAQQAKAALKKIRAVADATFVISADSLLGLVDKQTPLFESYRILDQIFAHGIKGLADLLTQPSMVRLDAEEIRALITRAGACLFATAHASGENKVIQAVQKAYTSPLLQQKNLVTAKGVLVCLAGSENLTLHDVSLACQWLEEQLGTCSLHVGTVLDPQLADRVQVTLWIMGEQEVKEEQSEMPVIPVKAKAKENLPAVKNLRTDNLLLFEESLEDVALPQIPFIEEEVELVSEVTSCAESYRAPVEVHSQAPTRSSWGAPENTVAFEWRREVEQVKPLEKVTSLHSRRQKSGAKIMPKWDLDDERYDIPTFIRRRAD